MVKTSKELVEILVRAEDEIIGSFKKCKEIVKSEGGDLTLDIEEKYTHQLGKFLNDEKVYATIVSEGKLIHDYEGNKKEYIIFLDPDEGSTNFHSGKLPHGGNIIVFPASPEVIRVKDWVSVLVSDRHNGIKYVAFHSGDKNLVQIIEGEKRRSPNKKAEGQIIEVPAGYTKQDSGLFSQIAYYHAVMKALGNNQYRSVDSSGTRLVDVVDGTTKCYIEGRNLVKLGGAWNLIPSAVIINAGGGKATHLDGTSFDNDIVWDQEKYKEVGGFNPNVGRDVLACYKLEDYKKCLKEITAIRGKESEYLSQEIIKAFK
ncbi:MAG: hypothetical protein KKF50_01770 [Nanoarchaeota archaeon]|nr:hypothetical protein [Nanoarchaeota archaeon]